MIVHVFFGAVFFSGAVFFVAIGAAALCIHYFVELKQIQEMASIVPRGLRGLAYFIFGLDAVLFVAFLMITVRRLVIDTWRRAKQAT